MFIYRNRKAQSTAEYALIIVAILAAVVVMSTYVKKSVMGKIKENADKIAPQFDPKADTGGYTYRWADVGSGKSKTTETRAVGGDTTTKIEAEGDGEKVTHSEDGGWGTKPDLMETGQ